MAQRKRKLLLKVAAVGGGTVLAAISTGCSSAGLPAFDGGTVDEGTGVDAFGSDASRADAGSIVVDAGLVVVDAGTDSGVIVGVAPLDAGEQDSGPITGIIAHDAGFIGNTAGDGG